MTPTVSVILPTFNRNQTIMAAVNSVLTQSFADFELIIVDDGSAQDVGLALGSVVDWRVKIIRRQTNGGAAAARNTGIAAAKGTFIAFQDSDDLWLPRKLEQQLELFERLPQDIGIVTSHRILYGRDEHFNFGPEKVCVVPSLRRRSGDPDQLAAMLGNNRLSLPCALFRRSIWPDSDWFDVCAKANEDWEFAVRICQRTRIYEDDRPVMVSFISADSISSSRSKQSLGTVRILRVNRQVLGAYPRQRAAILLDVARSLEATGKPRWARRFLLQSLATHPTAGLLVAQSLLRRAVRIMQHPAQKPDRSQAMTESSQSSTLAQRAILLAQRHSHHIPRPLRAWGRRLAGRIMPATPRPMGWDKPLCGEGPLKPAPEAQASTPERPARSAANAQLPLRCLIVTGVFDVGGTDEVAAFLARRLPEYGIATMVAHTGSTLASDPSMGGRLPRQLKQEAIKVEDVNEHNVDRLIESWRPDVISAHCPPPWWIEAATRAGVPFVETLHGMHDLFDADWSQESLRSSAKVRLIAVSELVRRQYLQGNPSFDPTRIVTVPNSVDPARVEPVAREQARAWLGLDEQFLFVCLARHALQKNAYALVDAFGELASRHANAHLLIAGRPDNPQYLSQIELLRKRLPWSDRVHLRDHAPWPTAVLAAADCFVMNSYFEGWSLATMEALCSGLPVISSEVGGAREQLGDTGERGVLIANPLGDPLAVNWRSIGASLYRPQANRAELIAAMSMTLERQPYWAEARPGLRAESLARFHADHALNGHARVLRASAVKQPRRAAAS